MIQVNLFFLLLPTVIALAAFAQALYNGRRITAVGRVIENHVTTCVEIVSRHRGHR